MSVTGRSGGDAPAASELAVQLRDAGFVRFVGAATGDALAASGVLARALGARDRPFQISLAPLSTDAARSTEADLTVAVGRTDPAADLALPGTDRPASETAAAVARELGDDPDAALALAGAVAAGRSTGSEVADAARDAGIERRPGVAVPTTGLADGLAHSTLVHAPFSGDVEAAEAAVDRLDVGDDVDASALDEEDRRRVASLVALRAVGPDDVPSRGGDAVEAMLRPFAGGPFGTVGGYADVLDAVSRERPGTGVALALGHGVETAALDAWRSHARRAHEAIRSASTERYDGLSVARAESGDAPVETMARLVHDYRSPEPVTLAVAEGAAAAVSDGPDLGAPFDAAAAAVDGVAEATGSTGRARFDVETAAFVRAFREAR